MTCVTIVDDGWLDLTIEDPFGEGKIKGIDTFSVYNRMLDIWNTEEEKAKELGGRANYQTVWASVLSEHLGVKVSERFAVKLFDVLKVEVNRLGKKDHSEDPASIPKPTDSPSGHTTG